MIFLHTLTEGPRYVGSIHGKGGSLLLVLAVVLAACDALAFFQRAFIFFRSPNWGDYRLFWRSVVLNQSNNSSPEYSRLIPEDSGEYTLAELHPHDGNEHNGLDNANFVGTTDASHRHSSEGEWVQSPSLHRSFSNHPTDNRRESIASDYSEETLHTLTSFTREESPDSHNPFDRRRLLLSRIGYIAFATAERCLMILAFVQLLTGLTVYTGICRGNYQNGCMAHLISKLPCMLYYPSNYLL